MNLKYFENIDGTWLDVSGQPGAALEYNNVSGWVVATGYKSYVAQITQTTTIDPTAIVLENTLGFVPDWKRYGEGQYGFDWDVDFNSNKCAILFLNTTNKTGLFDYNSFYNIMLSTNSDGHIQSLTIEIRYYN